MTERSGFFLTPTARLMRHVYGYRYCILPCCKYYSWIGTCQLVFNSYYSWTTWIWTTDLFPCTDCSLKSTHLTILSDLVYLSNPSWSSLINVEKVIIQMSKYNYLSHPCINKMNQRLFRALTINQFIHPPPPLTPSWVWSMAKNLQ